MPRKEPTENAAKDGENGDTAPSLERFHRLAKNLANVSLTDVKDAERREREGKAPRNGN